MRITLLAAVVALLVASQVQAELIDFGETGLMDSGGYVMEDYAVTITFEGYEYKVGDVEYWAGWGVWDGADHTGDGGGAGQGGSNGGTSGEDLLASIYFSAPVSVDSLWLNLGWYGVDNDPGTVVGRLGGVEVYSASVLTGGEWTEYTGGAGQMIDELAFSSTDPAGVDDLTITPEPATLALLGIGGLGMLIRRRKA